MWTIYGSGPKYSVRMLELTQSEVDKIRITNN